jgi:metal-responsive CopG/Arc/MetJ family transcriptional regulator
MKTVRMKLAAALLADLDALSRNLGTTRSAFAREALRAALARMTERELEHQHRQGYGKRPARKDEFLQ